MDFNGSAPPGMISQNRNILRIDNALIEEVNANNRSTGYVLISYEAEGPNNMLLSNLLRLNVGKHTMITNEIGEYILLNNLRKGMRVDVTFSAAMTRSIPPQTRAFQISVRAPELPINVKMDRIVDIDVYNGFLTTGNPNDIYDQMRFTISDSTLLLDQNGNQISIWAFRPGQMVRVEHAAFQTMSIPPQSPAYRIQLI